LSHRGKALQKLFKAIEEQRTC
ncbi:non-canonical purine NTP pyrophosphatase, partial [Vibrio parahaemolyticus]|nr:non-canonical purine NTP pyrophosphatase [Vibrio parahaemolyticus]